MRKVKRLFLAALLGITPGIALAQSEPPSKLEQLRKEMADAEASIQTITTSLKAAKNELIKIQNSISALGDKENKLKAALNKVQKNKSDVQRVVQDLQGRLLELQERSQARVRALYMLAEGQQPRLLYSKGYDAFSRSAVYMQAIRKMDQDEAQEVLTLRAKHNTENEKLNDLVTTQQQLLTQVSTQRKELDQKRVEQQQVSEGLQKKKKELETLMVTQRAQELRLETVLKGLTGGDQTSAHPSNAAEQGKTAAFEGDGLSATKSLVNPLKGALIKKFGEGEGVTKKGILIRGTGPSVVAVADGKVVFIGKLPQLGTVLILDHGNRDFSLYGKLSEATVALGSTVPAGNELGKVPEADAGDTRAPNFYFEIRRKGVSSDPLLNRYGAH